MIALDIFCLVICGILLLQGIWYGFLKGLFFIVAWCTAAVGAYFSYDILGSFLSGIFEWNQTTIRILCIAIGFLIPFLLFSILGRFLHKAITNTVLNLPNRFLGALLGLFKSILICSFILTIVHILPLTSSWEQARQKSVAYNLYLQELTLFGIDNTAPDIKGFVKEKTNIAIENTEQKIKESAKEIVKESVEKNFPKKELPDSSKKASKVLNPQK